MFDLITIIINTYNSEKYVKRCLESVINQTYKNLDILIVDDGSTDKTLNICKSIKDKRIRTIKGPHKGLSYQRNIGINNSKGKYLYFIDSDDYIEEDTIEHLYKNIKNNNTLISTCEVIDIYPNKRVSIPYKEEIINNISGIDMVKKILLNIGRNGTIWNLLIDKSLFKNIKFEDRIINDICVVYKLYLSAKTITYSNQVKYYYYRHKDSIVGNNQYERSIDLIKAVMERYKIIDKKYPNMKENKICVLNIIVDQYIHGTKKLKDYIIDNKYIEKYNSLFKFELFECNLRINDKIKLLLFRINPNLCNRIVWNHLKHKKKDD